MKRIFLLLAPLVLTVLVSSASASLSHIDVYSTVDYDSNTNIVSGYSYTTYPAGAGLYYQPQVTAQLSDANGNPLVWDFMATETGTARVDLQAQGSGCQYYTMTGWHAEDLYYYVTYYPAPLGYIDGYEDPHNYSLFAEGEYQAAYITNVFEGFGPMRIREESHIELGSTTRSSSGTCDLPPEVTFVPFDVVGKAATRSVNVIVFPLDNTSTVTLRLRKMSGSTGDAKFTSTNSTTRDITSSGVFEIQGVTESSAKDNMAVEAIVDSNTLPNPEDFSVARMKLLRTIGSQTSEITDGTVDTIVGERMKLTAQILPSGITPSSESWTIPEKSIDQFETLNAGGLPDFTRTPEKGQTKPITPAKLSSDQVDFIWYDGGGTNVEDFVSKEVQHASTINGYVITGKSSFHVKKPKVTLTVSAPGTTRIGTDPQQQHILLFATANFSKQGISFTRSSTSMPSSFLPGTFQFVQVMNGTIFILYRDASTTTLPKIGLDGCYPYGTDPGTDVSVKDVPSITLDAPNFLTRFVEYNSQWQMFLEFKPAGTDSEWVPLKVVDWAWDATASYGTSGPYTYSGIVEPQTHFTVSEATDYPLWIHLTPAHDCNH